MKKLQMLKQAMIAYVANSVKAIWSVVTHPLTIEGKKNCNVKDYKIYGNSYCGVLPIDYQQVEYIEATGKQYLEINYIASNITTTKGSFQLTDVDTGLMLFGSRESNNHGGLSYALNWGGEKPYKYYNTFNRSASSSLTDKEIDLDKHTFEKAKNKLYIDGELIHTNANTTFTTPYNMIVFGCNNKGKVGYLAKARIFNMQFYDNDVLKVDLIPCYRKSDKVIGMYDLVTGTFYTNKGTDVFLKGEVLLSPEAPIKVQSVGDLTTQNLLDKDNVKATNTGSTTKVERIDTGIALVTKTTTTRNRMTYLDLGAISDYEGQTVQATMNISKVGSESYSSTRFVTFDAETNTRTNLGTYTADGDKIHLKAEIKSGYTTERLLMRLYVVAGDEQAIGVAYNFNNLMFFTGEEVLEYEPYHKYEVPIAVKGEKNTGTVNIYLDEPLMSMSYAGKKCVDYIDSVENVVIRYCYQEVYNGTESWELRDAPYPNTFSKRITHARHVVCSHYKTSSSNYDENTTAANNSIRIFITDSRFSTVDEFKAYLAQQAEVGTPVTAVFLSQAAYNGSPTVKPIELPKLPQFKGTTVYEAQTEIPPSGIKVQYYG